MKVTVLTATYNRESLLPILYNSLLRQTNGNFDWVIIDDGSTDNTTQLVQGFMEEKKIKIKYYKTLNGGKHRAINKGIAIANGDLVIIVDSDDYLTDNAIDVIIKYGEKYKNSNIAVLSFLKQYPDGTINGPKYEIDEYIGKHMEERLNKDNWGDKAEVCYSEKLKKFRLPEIEGEYFMSEGYLWIEMGLQYDTAYINKPIYIADYLESGLTKNIYKIRYNNPKGCIKEAQIAYNEQANNIIKCKSMMKYIAYSKIAKISIKQQYKQSKSKRCYIFCLIPGLLFGRMVEKKGKR